MKVKLPVVCRGSLAHNLAPPVALPANPRQATHAATALQAETQGDSRSSAVPETRSPLQQSTWYSGVTLWQSTWKSAVMQGPDTRTGQDPVPASGYSAMLNKEDPLAMSSAIPTSICPPAPISCPFPVSACSALQRMCMLVFVVRRCNGPIDACTFLL